MLCDRSWNGVNLEFPFHVPGRISRSGRYRWGCSSRAWRHGRSIVPANTARRSGNCALEAIRSGTHCDGRPTRSPLSPVSRCLSVMLHTSTILPITAYKLENCNSKTMFMLRDGSTCTQAVAFGCTEHQVSMASHTYAETKKIEKLSPVRDFRATSCKRFVYYASTSTVSTYHFVQIEKYLTIRYDTIEEFNVDSKAEYTA